KAGSMKLIPFAPSNRAGRLIVAARLWWFAAAFMAVAMSSASAAATGSFTLVGSMSQFRRQHTATLLLNGKVPVAGRAPFLPAAASEIYDPVTTTWTNSGRLNIGREFHTATLLADGGVMVTGGQSANQLLAQTEVYDPPSGRGRQARFFDE